MCIKNIDLNPISETIFIGLFKQLYDLGSNSFIYYCICLWKILSLNPHSAPGRLFSREKPVLFAESVFFWQITTLLSVESPAVQFSETQNDYTEYYSIFFLNLLYFSWS